MENREFKFRQYYEGNDDSPPEWNYFDLRNGHMIVDGGWLHPQQYTGLKDMKGVEIYEGDVVAYDTEDGICAAVVEWVKDVDPDRDLSPIVGPGYLFVDPFQVREYEEDEDAIELEVIGNIYENPGLTGEQS
ncbi:YopX family protein [Rhodococcus sp. HS-D2]|uniref:YopX family protein n=1 Tax=Rhodococcus sp. HS-D2 TaxID=1384636 RepID=UPI0012E888E9|nr:YopX family protein [Rhodococcus sp. HS-D2]